MKKSIFTSTLIGCLAFVACNSNPNLGPEYSTPPIINRLTFSPTGVVDSATVVTVTADITSEYGLYASGIGVNYILNDDSRTVAGSLATPVDSLPNLFVSTIPKQAIGTKVDFIFIAQNPYAALVSSKQYTYTVGDPAGITMVTETMAPTPASN